MSNNMKSVPDWKISTCQFTKATAVKLNIYYMVSSQWIIINAYLIIFTAMSHTCRSTASSRSHRCAWRNVGSAQYRWTLDWPTPKIARVENIPPMTVDQNVSRSVGSTLKLPRNNTQPALNYWHRLSQAMTATRWALTATATTATNNDSHSNDTVIFCGHHCYGHHCQPRGHRWHALWSPHFVAITDPKTK